MGPANCRGLLKFAMSSIAACALDASIARPAATAQRLVFMEPSLADRYDREEFWGRQLPIAFVRQNTKNFARLSSARGRRILGRVVGQFFGVSDPYRRDTAIQGPGDRLVLGSFQARSGRAHSRAAWCPKTGRALRDFDRDRDRAQNSAPVLDCRKRVGDIHDGGAIKRRLRCRQPSPSLSPRR